MTAAPLGGRRTPIIGDDLFSVAGVKSRRFNSPQVMTSASRAIGNDWPWIH